MKQANIRWLVIIMALLAGLVFINCSDDDDPVVVQQPGGQTTQLDADLTGAQEVPSVTTTATGTGDLTISADETSISFTLTVANIQNITAAHIHVGATGVNGPVIFNLSTTTFTSPLTGTLTAADLVVQSAQNINTFADAILALRNGNTYINVHTTQNPNGEIRGQIGVVVTPTPTPTAPQDDSFTWIGNTPLTVVAAQGVLANDPAGSTISASDTTTALNGTVAVAADGGFSYTPPPGVSGTDTFTYTVTGVTTATTVTIQMDSIAWYVDNTVVAGGTGTQADPFNSLASATASAAPGDTIFVFSGAGITNQNLGITLTNNQRLIGQGIAFTFEATVGNPITIVPAGAPPVITETLGVVNGIVNLANNNEVAGFSIQGDPAANDSGISGVSSVGFNIHDNSITTATRQGIELINATGTGIIVDNTIDGNAQGNGIDMDIITPFNGDLTIMRNTLTNIAETGVRVVTTGGTATISNNTLTTMAVVNNQGRGIDLEAIAGVVASTLNGNDINTTGRAGLQVQGNVTAQHTAVIDGNTIAAAGDVGGDGAIDLEANDSGVLNVNLTNNLNITPNAGADAIDVQSGGAGGVSTVCARIVGNSSAAAIVLDNGAASALNIQDAANAAAVTAANNGMAVNLAGAGIVTFNQVCGF